MKKRGKTLTTKDKSAAKKQGKALATKSKPVVTKRGGAYTKKEKPLPVKRGKVLVVEDNPKWSERLTECLQENGFHVVAIKTKEEALKILEQEHFHFATVDLQLDEGTLVDAKFEGWEVMKSILDKSLERTMPIMVLTGFPGDEENSNEWKALHEYKATYFGEKAKWDKKEFIDTVIKAVEWMDIRFKNDNKP